MVRAGGRTLFLHRGLSGYVYVVWHQQTCGWLVTSILANQLLYDAIVGVGRYTVSKAMVPERNLITLCAL